MEICNFGPTSFCEAPANHAVRVAYVYTSGRTYLDPEGTPMCDEHAEIYTDVYDAVPELEDGTQVRLVMTEVK